MPRRTSKFFSLTGKVKLQIRRSQGGGEHSDITGLWEPSPKKIVEIEANVQPFKFSQTMLLSEADRTKEWLNVWSENEIKKAEDGDSGIEADVFIYRNKVYKVMDVKVWTMGVLDHYHAHAALDSPTPWEKLDG